MVGQHRKRDAMNLSSASPSAGLCGRGKASINPAGGWQTHMPDLWLEMPCVAAAVEPQAQHRWSTTVWACPVWAVLLHCHRQVLWPELNQQCRNAQCPCSALSTAPFHGQEVEKKGKSKTETAVLQGIYFSRESWCELYTAEMNFAVPGEHQDNWPKENAPAWFASMEWHWRAERTCPLLSCHLASFSYFWAGKHMWLAKGKNRLPKLWPSTNPCVWKGKNTVNATFSPGLFQPAGGCIPLKQHFRKKILELGLKTSLPAFLCYKPLRQESMSLPISLQRHSLEQAHSKAVSTVMPKIFKINFWRHHLTKDALLFWSCHWKPAAQYQTVWWTTHTSVSPTKGYQSKPGVGRISWNLFTDQGAENCISESKQPRDLTLLAHIIFFYI